MKKNCWTMSWINTEIELFNIIARKLDQIRGQKGFGEKIIKDS